ncbi:MAG: penicillin-binding protein 2 [Alphaproteobacteria bacterium]
MQIDQGARRRPVSPALMRSRARLRLAGFVLVGLLCVLGLRLIVLMGFAPDRGEGARIAAQVAAKPRAPIVDRNGEVLALSVPVMSAYADPSLMIDPRGALEKLITILPDLAPRKARLDTAFRDDGRKFLWLKRHLSMEEQDALQAAKIEGIGFRQEYQRRWPKGRLAAHVVGLTDIDGKGLEGLELSRNDRLVDSETPLQLTMDIRLQHKVRDALADMIEMRTAKSGSALVLDAETSGVLASVSLPDFDPVDRGVEGRFNANVQGVYEMGSTFKLFNTALALDQGYTPQDGYKLTPAIRVGRFTIRDYHPHPGFHSIADILRVSSNVGSIHMVRAAGKEAQRDFMGRLGMLKSIPGLELGGAGRPGVPSPWRDISAVTIAYGYGLSVTPLHLVAATGALVNGGNWCAPRYTDEGMADEARCNPVLTDTQSEQMRRMMRYVVEAGTGKAADVPGMLVGGKTGTTEIGYASVEGGKAVRASFIAAFPMHKPRYIVYAMIEDPQKLEGELRRPTGGKAAAPVVGEIIKAIASLNALPEKDRAAPDIAAALDLDLPKAGGH